MAKGSGGGAFGATSSRRTQVHIEGLPELKKTLTKVMPREARNILRRTVTVVARDVRDDLRAGAAKRTRTLEKAIRSRRDRGTRDEARAGVYITHGKGAKRDAWYWHMVEWGTRKVRAQPFIGPTVRRWESLLANRFRRSFRGEFEKEMAKRARKK